MTANHIAAIHVLKARLRLADDDYRALLVQLTGQPSSKSMTQAQRRTVRRSRAAQPLQRLTEHPVSISRSTSCCTAQLYQRLGAIHSGSREQVCRQVAHRKRAMATGLSEPSPPGSRSALRS